MKRIRGLVLTGTGAALICCVAVQSVWAQAPRPASQGVAIRFMPVPGTGMYQNAPSSVATTFNPSASSVTHHTPRSWAVFDVQYETVQDWTDELVINFYILLEKQHVPEKKFDFSFYQTTVHYANINRGLHMGGVVLNPGVIERYGVPVALGVTISSVDGTVLAVAETTADNKTIPKDPKCNWWDNPKLVGKDVMNVTKRDGLVDRSKSPFALMNVDDYEVVK